MKALKFGTLERHFSKAIIIFVCLYIKLLTCGGKKDNGIKLISMWYHCGIPKIIHV